VVVVVLNDICQLPEWWGKRRLELSLNETGYDIWDKISPYLLLGSAYG